jgi:hypothetical protein
MAGTLLSAARKPPQMQEETRASLRHPCELPTTCQPPSAWGRKDPWPATIRDISTGGLSLALSRRFERGAGLAIELPGEAGTASTVLARVTHVRPHPDGGWILGCSFISELSDQELQTILDLSTHRQPPSSDEIGSETLLDVSTTLASGAIKGVLFQARLRRRPDERGEVIRWFIRRLDLGGCWPLARGMIIGLQVRGLPVGTPPVEMKVRNCEHHDDLWVVNGTFVLPPAPEVLRALLSPAT